MPFKFGKATSSRRSFYKLRDEKIIHIFYGCLIVKTTWNQHDINFFQLRILGLRYE